MNSKVSIWTSGVGWLLLDQPNAFNIFWSDAPEKYYLNMQFQSSQLSSLKEHWCKQQCHLEVSNEYGINNQADEHTHMSMLLTITFSKHFDPASKPDSVHVVPVTNRTHEH